MLNWLGNLPGTNFRIFITQFSVLLTTIRYTATDTHIGKLGFDPWTPSWEWLLFLAAMSGLDLTQFYAKRLTHIESPPNTKDVEDTPNAKIQQREQTEVSNVRLEVTEGHEQSYRDV